MTAGPDQTPILDVEDLSVDIPVAEGDLHAVCQVSFAVHREETFCLVGESGCGKSVMSRALIRLNPSPPAQTQGLVLLDGENLYTKSKNEMRAIRGSKAAMIFQEPMTSLNPVFTIGQQMTAGIREHLKMRQSFSPSSLAALI